MINKEIHSHSLPKFSGDILMLEVKPAKEDFYWLARQFKNLARGCKEHPSYRAKRKPTADCGRCNDMWLISQDIIEQHGNWFD